MSDDIKLRQVISTCRERAAEFREGAKRFTQSRNRDLEMEYQGMALAAERLADEFESLMRDSEVFDAVAIEDRARGLNPVPFANYEAMLVRLRQSGVDEIQAERSAKMTYGAEMDGLRERAKAALSEERAATEQTEAYHHGFEDAILWHEQRAREADNLAHTEKDSTRKAKLQQRAERHRLYAKHMRIHLADMRASDRVRMSEQQRAEHSQQQLPLEVQAAFLKRTDNLAGEAFD